MQISTVLIIKRKFMLTSTEISIASLIVSCVTFLVVVANSKIANAKLKLDLYNKRFDIYKAVLDFHNDGFVKDGTNESKNIDRQFIKAFRESKFIFNPEDGIDKLINNIMQTRSKIVHYQTELEKDDLEKFLDRIDESEHRSILSSLRLENSSNMMKIEIKLEKYLMFKEIDGWNFWSFNFKRN